MFSFQVGIAAGKALRVDYKRCARGFWMFKVPVQRAAVALKEEDVLAALGPGFEHFNAMLLSVVGFITKGNASMIRAVIIRQRRINAQKFANGYGLQRRA